MQRGVSLRKFADSLSDNELSRLADYYNMNRDDRLDLSGDVGRYFLFGGMSPMMAYNYNRTGGTQLMWLVPKSRTLKKRTQKEVDWHNLLRNIVVTALGAYTGGVAGALSLGGSAGRNVAVGAGTGGLAALAMMQLAQRLGRHRARRMLAGDPGNDGAGSPPQWPAAPPPTQHGAAL